MVSDQIIIFICRMNKKGLHKRVNRWVFSPYILCCMKNAFLQVLTWQMNP